MKKPILLLLALFSMSICYIACGPKVAAWSPAGTWNVTVKGTPEGNIQTKMVIVKKGDQYEGMLVNGNEKSMMKELSVDGKNMKCNVNSMGYYVEITGLFEADTFNGKVSVEGMDFPVSGNREMVTK